MNQKLNKNFLLFFIIFFTAFLLGFLSSFILKEKTENLMGKTEKNTEQMVSENQKSQIDLTKFNKVYDFMKANHYDFEKITEKDLIDSTIHGLVKGLGDKHSEYFNVEEKTSFSESLNQEFEGIGAVVAEDKLGVKLDRIFKGSPAKKYGLLKNDIIISADGVKLAGVPLKKAISHIKGPAGSSVKLEVYRKGETDILLKTVVRNKIDVPSVESEKLEGNIGYIALSSFGDKTNTEFEKALLDLKDTDGLILDLRENGGGYLEASVKILSKFIENGKTLIITKEKEDVVTDVYTSINYGKIYAGKIVVLINENSASASEITAGALRDYDKAILVGKKSYGKGSVQLPFNLGDGSMVKLTIAKWFTPKDKNIDGEGIIPDIEINFHKEDYDFELCKQLGKCKKNMKKEDFVLYDRQKEEAKKILNMFIKKDALQLVVDEYKESIK